MNDRIKLAKALGWTELERGLFWPVKNCLYGMPPDKKVKRTCPDPFKSADDDYAVLEWMRDDSRRMGFPRYVGALSDVMDNRLANSHAANYKVGDYARAALLALDDDNE